MKWVGSGLKFSPDQVSLLVRLRVEIQELKTGHLMMYVSLLVRLRVEMADSVHPAISTAGQPPREAAS